MSTTTTSHKMRLTFIAKLRWVAKRPNEQMSIRNFEAIRLQAMSIQHEKKEEWGPAKVAQGEAVQTLNDELKDYMAGQQLVVPMSTGAEFGFGGIGGVQ